MSDAVTETQAAEVASATVAPAPAVNSVAPTPAARGEPSVLAENLGVRYLVRYHRNEVTLRETFVRLLPGRKKPARWQGEFWSLTDVNMRAYPGEIVGIVGKNGAGKTTLLKALAGICGADTGRVAVRGRVGCLMSFGVGFRPNLSGRENVYLNGTLLGLTKRQIDERIGEIADFSELGDFFDAQVRTYSAGMKGRLGFSIAIHIQPDVLLLDEVLTVGDASFRAKAGTIVERFRTEDKTVILASHNMPMLRQRCTRCVWLERGSVRMEGDPREVTEAYAEYARGDGAEE